MTIPACPFPNLVAPDRRDLPLAALLLLLNGYFGYSGVLLAVGAAAAVNLVERPRKHTRNPLQCRVSGPSNR